MNALFDYINDELFRDTARIMRQLYPERQKPQISKDCTWLNQYAMTDKDGKVIGTEMELLLPGYAKDEITLSIKDGMIHLSAERKTEETEKKTIHKAFAVSEKLDFDFSIDERTDLAKISSRLENGILTIAMPFLPEQQKTDAVRILIE